MRRLKRRALVGLLFAALCALALLGVVLQGLGLGPTTRTSPA